MLPLVTWNEHTNQHTLAMSNRNEPPFEQYSMPNSFRLPASFRFLFRFVTIDSWIFYSACPATTAIIIWINQCWTLDLLREMVVHRHRRHCISSIRRISTIVRTVCNYIHVFVCSWALLLLLLSTSIYLLLLLRLVLASHGTTSIINCTFVCSACSTIWMNSCGTENW